MPKKKYVMASLLALPLAAALTGCDVGELMQDKADKSTTRNAATSEQAVKDGILPGWVPSGGSNVQLVQRNSGSERIFVMDYAGKLPGKSCTPVKTPGKPSGKELAAAYATDERVKRMDPEEISATRTLEADWWPDEAQSRTTDLCGRFWVHQSDGKLYAFAPDAVATVEKIQQERQQESAANN